MPQLLVALSGREGHSESGCQRPRALTRWHHDATGGSDWQLGRDGARPPPGGQLQQAEAQAASGRRGLTPTRKGRVG
jgi:hypothetical protein